MSSFLATSASNEEFAPKRRRINQNCVSLTVDNPDSSVPVQPTVVKRIPKRGARACAACRRGKNRCEGEAPCRRCAHNGIPCVYEKPDRKPPGVVPASSERLSKLEDQFLFLRSHMIGIESSLDRILAAIQDQHGMQQQPIYSNGSSERSRHEAGSGTINKRRKHARYGRPNSTTPSEEESEDNLPRETSNTPDEANHPIEALQGLANAAAELAAAPSNETERKHNRFEPIPRRSFLQVIEKGIVSDTEAQELFKIFFTGCHFFIPIFDPVYDKYESLKNRTPCTFDAILAIASKIRSGNGPLEPAFYKCLEEAQGIARSFLFGSVVRKEAVQGMLLLAAWNTNGWLPSGHAVRMAIALGLNRALEKLADDNGKKRDEEEERDLVISARIWLCVYWFDGQICLGTGCPIVLRDENSIRHCRLLLSHRMASPTDVRLISQIELLVQKTQIYETLSPLHGQINYNTLSFIRRVNAALDKWWSDCDDLHSQIMHRSPLLRRVLAAELQYAKLWSICVALRGVSWDEMGFEQRELAFQAKDAAYNCLSIILTSYELRATLRYAPHNSLVTTVFSGSFLLKIAILFPNEVDLKSIMSQVEQLKQLLSEVGAGRYALALRFMLANLRRRVGVISGVYAPAPIPPPSFAKEMVISPTFVDRVPPDPFTMEELGFTWPKKTGIICPSVIPVWLQEQSLADLGLPADGPDSILVQPNGTNGLTGNRSPMLGAC